MKNNIIAVAVLILIAGLVLFGQAARGPVFENVPANVLVFENTPGFVPSSAADVYTQDLWIEEITLANTSGSSVANVCVDDKQGTPKAIVPCVSIAANTVYVIQFKARWAPGGVRWSAGTGGVVVGTVRGKRLGP